MSYEAIEIIRGEHRSLAAVLDAAKYLLDELRKDGSTPDFKLLRAIVTYIEEFPERLHHPKEDKFLFVRLRARTRKADELIDALQKEHHGGETRVQLLKGALSDFEMGKAGAREDFATKLERYTQFNLKHMMLEERELIPLAERYLTQDDWTEIAAVFRENRDPMFGDARQEQFRQLFHTIVNLMPPPLGLGGR